MSKLRNYKAPGRDQVTAEMLKLSGKKKIMILWKLCNEVWTTGSLLKDWVKSIFKPLQKKGSSEECGKYHTISLISHALKVLLNVIHEGLRYYIDNQIPQEQASFVKGRGTRK